VKNKYKKLTLIAVLSSIIFIQNSHSNDASDAINSNTIINLTGKLIELHFYSKMNSDLDLYGFIRPLAIGGASLTGHSFITSSTN